jgi:AmmeMemoRadiSam system protein A
MEVKRMDPYVKLARNTIDLYIREGKVYQPEDEELTCEMRTARAGAFVSIHENGGLRGCIGTIAPTRESVAEEIVSNAIAASTCDPRFQAIRKDELESLEISVDVLSPAEQISSPDELDVKRYGVIVEKDFRRGLLLPNLDGVDTIDYQIEIALRKAGIGLNETGVQLYRFEVVRHI